MAHRGIMTATLAVSVALLSSPAVHADVRTDEKSRIEFSGMLGRMFNVFGGKAAHDGVERTVAVKGDRKASMSEATGQIIDLAEEKVYDLDVKKKSYKVTTFAELRRRMEEAQKKMHDRAQTEGGTADQSAPDRQMEIDFDIRNTGEKKAINGFDTHQAIVTVTIREKGKTLEQGGGMVMTSDMWLAPTIREMKEIREFDMRFAQKLYGPVVAGASAEQMAAALAMYPMMKQAIAKMNAESGRIDGTPVLTTTTMETVKSAEQMASDAKPAEDQPARAPTSVSGLLGGFAKKAAAKRASSDDAGKARATFMTSTSEVLKVVTNVAPEDLAIPAGFKESK
jgi:hypothetical protein